MVENDFLIFSLKKKKKNLLSIQIRALATEECQWGLSMSLVLRD